MTEAVPYQRKPDWLRVPLGTRAATGPTRKLMRQLKLNTVCEEAACPNLGECWSRKHATVMILGATCTRACAFCNIATGKPMPPDLGEPGRVAQACFEMDLKHIVVTSVDRDDLDDGGAQQFVNTISALRAKCPQTSIEILTPDFRNKPDEALESIVLEGPDVFNHNLECVPRLYTDIRPGARYYHSLRLLDRVKQINPAIFTKSGLMLGLGESQAEIMQVLDDMRCAGVDFVTLGQYLQPSRKNTPVVRYLSHEEFDEYGRIARARGFLQVASSPLTRSSYHADTDFKILKQRRKSGLSSSLGALD